MSLVDRWRAGKRKAESASENASGDDKETKDPGMPAQNTVDSDRPITTSPRKYTEKDNRGKRLDRQVSAREYVGQTQRSFLQYSFDSRKAAETALRMNQCFFVASDTGNLIATQPFTFGCYRRDDGQFEVLLGGEALTSEIAGEMKSYFVHQGGRKTGERIPDRDTGVPDGERPKDVVFQKEYTELTIKGTHTCRMYWCQDPIAATVFLKRRQNFVNRRDFSIVVETPKVTYYRDFDGIHEKN